MQIRQIGALAIALGALAIALALLADSIGIGGNEDKFGWKQVTLLVVGIALAIGGVVALVRGPGEESGDAPGPPSEPT